MPPNPAFKRDATPAKSASRPSTQTLNVMKLPSPLAVFFALVAGASSVFVWAYLFVLWPSILSMLLSSTDAFLELGLRPDQVAYFFLALFSLGCAALFVFPLWFFMRRTLYASATIFITAFLAAFFVPVLLSNDPILLFALFNLTALWLFVISFLLLVFLAVRLSNER
jgi:hypothetical protein